MDPLVCFDVNFYIVECAVLVTVNDCPKDEGLAYRRKKWTITYVLRKLIRVSAVRVQVSNTLGGASAAKEMHEGMNTLLVVVVETRMVSLDTNNATRFTYSQN